jgi:diguanylate cyclase (GGDEF)-like protein/putative nucleotidyltransferase with HDIG domain
MAKVLLVDDEEGLRLIMSRQLRRAGHEVSAAEDGLAAVDLLRAETFDVVVSDMKMPRLDGMGLLQQAKQIAPDIEFIILTGHGNLDNAIEAFKTGNVFDYLVKPLDNIHELDGVVARAVERRFLRRENIRLVDELQSRIDELEDARSQLSRLAERDGLTGLLNHRTVHARLQEILATDRDIPVSIVMVDMDRFKELNDTYGHPLGDCALRHVAAALQAVFGESAAIGRCGGDEFMVVLPGKCALESMRLADSLHAYLVENPFRNPAGIPLPLQLCIGIADGEGTERSPLSLVAAADSALYQGKQSGGNSVKIHGLTLTSSEGTDVQSKFDVFDGLINTIDNKDRYTRKHSEHMTGFALQIAQAAGCSDETYNIVRVAGLLHDIGKIGIPDSILRKPGKLSDDEYEVMKSHVTLSALIIHGLPHMSDVLDAVANHHERWDGKGYPAGLAGDQIPYLGRIMAIADAFSAMTLDRPYRSAMDLEQALCEIEHGAGSQFDPDLARVFIDSMRASQFKSIEERRKAA